ncbi:MAG: hypothetical protein GKS00_11870 [Alphaproteobacteria bacterium]|nr:hypothetical protein [Alphaproteobacteria bacterium]
MHGVRKQGRHQPRIHPYRRAVPGSANRCGRA